eukprot:TRINITY_DN26987_c0_g2_i1.p1 TRINITY_DN26987_c0_g2~~TRINITY_DN26987_c0_g2_i1.p1  ORF type:complete len:360 (-),score=111.75 TRINITY_DN26987_c0_g2_i1:253-1332(-)
MGKTSIIEAAEPDDAEADAAERRKLKKEKKRKAQEEAADVAEANDAEADADAAAASKAERKRLKKKKKLAAEGEEVQDEADTEKVKKKKEKAAEGEEVPDADAAAERKKYVAERNRLKAERRAAEKAARAAKVAAGEEVESMKKKKKKNASAAAGKHKVFVSGLPWKATEQILRNDFTECGEVTRVQLLTDKVSGKSRGIAFIDFADESGVKEALKFDGDKYGGKTLKVARADKGMGKGASAQGENGTSEGKGKGKGKGKERAPRGEKPEHCTSIVVKGLSYQATEEDLMEAFKGCGEQGATNARILTDNETGESRGVAFVDFDDTNAVDDAIKLEGVVEIKGRSILIDYSKPRPHKIW